MEWTPDLYPSFTDYKRAGHAHKILYFVVSILNNINCVSLL